MGWAYFQPDYHLFCESRVCQHLSKGGFWPFPSFPKLHLGADCSADGYKTISWKMKQPSPIILLFFSFATMLWSQSEEAQIIETFPQSVYPKQFPKYTMRQQGRETYVYRNFSNSIFHAQFPSYVVRPVRFTSGDRYEIRELYPKSFYPKQFPVSVVRSLTHVPQTILDSKK